MEGVLDRKVDLLRQSTDYQQLLQAASAALLQGLEMSAVADAVLRPIAADLSSLNKGKIILHMYIVPGGSY